MGLAFLPRRLLLGADFPGEDTQFLFFTSHIWRFPGLGRYRTLEESGFRPSGYSEMPVVSWNSWGLSGYGGHLAVLVTVI